MYYVPGCARCKDADIHIVPLKSCIIYLNFMGIPGRLLWKVRGIPMSTDPPRLHNDLAQEP